MQIIDRDEFLRYYERIRERTLRVVACIPREQFEWTYQSGKFSFADLLRHLAGIERYMFAENARLRPSRYPGHGPELAEGWDGVMEYFDRCHRESMEIFRALSAEDLARPCVTPGGTQIAVWKWLRAMVEHEIHHRGQLYLYLSMLGVPTPPIYGMTSEQVRAASGSE